MNDPHASPTPRSPALTDDPGWMEQHLGRLQSFESEVAQLNQNVQSVLERAQAKTGTETIAPPVSVRAESSVSKPLTVRVGEVMNELDEHIQSITRNVSHLDRLI